jgi:hypothetical protein
MLFVYANPLFIDCAFSAFFNQVFLYKKYLNAYSIHYKISYKIERLNQTHLI